MMDYTSLLRSNIDTLEKFIFNLKYFIPSKTAQNGLNFFTKEDERVLYNLPDDEKYEPVVGIFKFIYILLKEDTNGISNIIKHFFDTIMKKFKADNLKNLFLNTVCPDLYLINQEQIDRILSLVNNNRNFLKSTVIFKVSRPASFLSFIIKEIFDYVTSKGFVLGVDLKQEEDKLQTMKDELKKLNK